MSSRILVVDDTEAHARTIAELFEPTGATVNTCTAAAQALELVRAHAFDLAFVDVRLRGGVAGIELVPQLKDVTPELEVVLITDSATLDTAIEAVRHGVFAYVQQPYDPEDLLALAARALSQVALRRERESLARDLAQSEAIYRGIVETAEALILGLDHGQVVFANRYAADTFGMQARVVHGKRFVDLAATDADKEDLVAALETVSTDEPVRELELSLDTGSGERRVVRWTIAPLAVEMGDGLLLAVGLEVTDRIDLERRAARTEALAIMGTLTAGLAHEVRNPLNAARLQLEVLARNAGRLQDEDVRGRIIDRVEVVKGEIGRLTTLLDEFLTLARSWHAERKPVDLRLLLSDVVTLEDPLAEREGLHIAVGPDLAAFTVSADRDKIKQVLVNLVTNSLEALRNQDDGEITLDAVECDGGFVEIRVMDNGPGILGTDEDLFEPFYTTKEAGTGLGLSIVKKIVEMHGGTIHVEPRGDGRGTVARFTLPQS